ncbi:MAG: hypothetical protein ACD_20C00109G0001, partial [uncultured bacterium]
VREVIAGTVTANVILINKRITRASAMLNPLELALILLNTLTPFLEKSIIIFYKLYKINYIYTRRYYSIFMQGF